jgi:hypothetical protein
MLSEETAAGKYPVEAVMMMDRIARAAESALDVLKFETTPSLTSTADSITRSSYFVAKQIDAIAIITPTWSGTTACRVCRFRPKQPIIATTPNKSVLHFLSLCWGVFPLNIPRSETLDDMIRYSIDAARGAGYVEPGQNAVARFRQDEFHQGRASRLNGILAPPPGCDLFRKLTPGCRKRRSTRGYTPRSPPGWPRRRREWKLAPGTRSLRTRGRTLNLRQLEPRFGNNIITGLVRHFLYALQIHP